MTEAELIAAYGGWPGYVEWVRFGVSMGWQDQGFLDALVARKPRDGRDE